MSNPHQFVKIEYTNWRGFRSVRRIRPRYLAFENNEWHPETQWILYAYDLERIAERTFAMANIHSWEPIAIAPAAAPPRVAELEAEKGRVSEIVSGYTQTVRPIDECLRIMGGRIAELEAENATIEAENTRLHTTLLKLEQADRDAQWQQKEDKLTARIVQLVQACAAKDAALKPLAGLRLLSDRLPDYASHDQLDYRVVPPIRPSHVKAARAALKPREG
jgi:hypothetical protein